MLLSLERVSKRFAGSPGREAQALADVTLQLERGQIIGIYGPTGAGKSTLLRIAAGLMKPDSGQVLYDGQALHELSTREHRRLRRREISCLWSGQGCQEQLSALEHVGLPLLIDGREHRRATAAAKQALTACEVAHCAHTDLRELSGGERQRVEIARAIVTEPRLLLADGPASSLSLIEQEMVMALLGALARQASAGVLIADSEAAALIGAETILYLNEGRLLDDSPGRDGGNVYELPTRARKAAAET